MRGIAGIVRFDGDKAGIGEIDRVVRTMALGAMDRIQSRAAGPAAFGHVQRRVVPEDRFEEQPFLSADGTLLVADALLDNRDELARALGLGRDDAARMADSALVLRSFERWGDACTEHLEGKFALAAWIPAERRVFCAADAFSLRPLYYHRRPGLFAFATTLRGLFAVTDIPRRINEGVLADFLLTKPAAFGDTIYQDVSVLKAAHHLHATAEGVKLRRYWEPDLSSRVELGSTREYVEAFSSELERAVAAGLRGEREIGIMVSGGLDSAAATVVAGRLLADRGKRLQAIHMLPEEGTREVRRAPLRDPDESRWVRLLQQQNPHIDFHFRPRKPGVLSLENWDAYHEQNLAPARGIVTRADDAQAEGVPDMPSLCRMLFGLGGNYVVSLETHGNGYLPQLMARMRWARLLRELKGHRDVYGRRRKELVRSELIEPLVRPLRRMPPDPRLDLIPLLNPDFVRRAEFMRRIAPLRRFRWDPKDFDTRLQRKWIMTDLMPQSVGVNGSVIGEHFTCEGHLPYFDRRLNAFCLAVPLEQQIDRGWDRLLLRRSMEGLLPREAAWRVSRGFPAVGLWEAAAQLRAALPSALGEMRRSSLAGAYLDLDAIERRFDAVRGQNRQSWHDAKFLNDVFCAGWFLRWLDGNRG
jgi:asparagine synthase (glutamine-hydrolysing)